MTESDLTADVVAVGRAAGLDAVGVADTAVFERERAVIHRRRAAGLHGGMQFTFRNPDRSTDPRRALPSARSMVVGALSYARTPPVAPAGAAGRVARYAWRDTYADLRTALAEVAGRLTEGGYRAVVLADDNALVDRAAAVRAGIGWYGKNANVLVPGRGSWFVLGAVLTDADLEPSAPLDDGCGSCRRCLDDGCPTGAVIAPGVIDARRCLAWTVQTTGVIPADQRVALGDRLYGCDDCQEICPPSRVELRNAPAPHSDAVAFVDVVALLETDDDELMDTFGRWYVPRREPRYLRRNALVVIGNTADPDDPRVERALTAALACGDPIVVAHAVWAPRRLGLDHLLSAIPPGVADDPLVTTELRAHVPRRAGSAGLPDQTRERPVVR